VRELRVPKHNAYGQTASGYFDTPEALAAAAVRFDGNANVFFTLNPVLPDLLARANNRVVDRSEHATADQEVARRRWLFIDIDPVRPAGISSTEAERRVAQALVEDLAAFLTGEGWPAPIVAMSGNGYYALYRVDMVNTPDSTALLKAVLSALASRFDTNDAHIDTSVHNAARIIGLVGTLKVKGDATEDRPHRMSQLVAVPETLSPVTVAQLYALVPAPATKPYIPATRAHAARLTDLLAQNQIDYKEQPADANGVTWYHVRRCPFHEDGRDF
jgi:hypothetical protein